jgi:2-dehydropantoate 2-reductase
MEMSLMRILVVGAGSTGGYFGGRLAQAGRDVTFLVRPARAAALRANGLQIISPHGDATLTPQIVTADEVKGPFDAVLMTVKGFSLDAAIEDCAPAVGPQTIVLSFLNGMRHFDVLTARFGKERVVGCVCKVGTTLDDQGRILHINKLHSLAYGEVGGSPSERTDRLDKEMQGAGFDAQLTRTIEREMWEKWILLATMGATTCMMRGTIGETEAAPGGADLALAIFAESVAVATAAGHPPSEPFVTATKAIMTKKDSPQAPSMYRDLQKGLPVEAEQIVGDMAARGRKLGVPTPLLAAAFAHLCVYQNPLGRAGDKK